MECPNQNHLLGSDECMCICWPCDFEGRSVCGVSCDEHKPDK